LIGKLNRKSAKPDVDPAQKQTKGWVNPALDSESENAGYSVVKLTTALVAAPPIVVTTARKK
jgi:hypothetical protein